MEKSSSEIKDSLLFLDMVVNYLHSWMCTKDGEYKMYGIQDVRRAAMMLLATGDSEDIINRFTNQVNDGTIVMCDSKTDNIADNVKIELYKSHLKNMKKFEENNKWLLKALEEDGKE